MNDYIYIISGYFLLFLVIILFYFRLKNITLEERDEYFLMRIFNFGKEIKNIISRFFNVFGKGIIFSLKGVREKVLLRIKIEALKIQTWASKKLEEIKKDKSLFF